MLAYYQVGQEQFSNRFLATEHASKNSLAVQFNLYEQAFDQHNWLVEPSQSWDELLDLRAQQIRAKNKPIVLYLSGGTDSYTVYQVFKRNGIPFDAIYVRIKREPIEIKRAQGTLELIKQDLEFTGTHTKVIIRYDDFDSYRLAYNSPNWIIDKSIRYHFSLITGGDTDSDAYIAQQIGTEDFVSITGLEKPRLHFDSTGVYSYQDDTNFGKAMTSPINDCFFISPELPELHIKQSYLLLNYLKSRHPRAFTPIETFKKYNEFHDATKFDWLEYSLKGCGRFGDVNLSTWQHFSNIKSYMHMPADGQFKGNEYRGRSAEWFNTLKDDPAVKNYLAGLMLVFNDPLIKPMFTSDSNFYSIKEIRSKYYKLKF